MGARTVLRGVRVMYGGKKWITVHIDRDYCVNRRSLYIIRTNAYWQTERDLCTLDRAFCDDEVRLDLDASVASHNRRP